MSDPPPPLPPLLHVNRKKCSQIFRFEPKLPANLDTGGSSFDSAEAFLVEARSRLSTQAQVSAVSLLESYAAEQGNICDLGNLATVCVIERSKLWTSSSVVISSRGAGHDSVASVPFTSLVNMAQVPCQRS